MDDLRSRRIPGGRDAPPIPIQRFSAGPRFGAASGPAGEPGDPTGWRRLAPVLDPEADPAPEVEHALAAVARAAAAGDLAARDALWFALGGKIDRSVRRCRLPGRGGPTVWERADLAQEAFVVFAEVLAAWPAGDAFLPFFLAHFPWRLRDAVRRWEPPTAVHLFGADDELPLAEDGSAAAEQARARLEALAADLPAPDGDILRWRVGDGEQFAAIAARLELDRRTVHRRWRLLLAELRRSLLDEGADAGDGGRLPGPPRVAEGWLLPPGPEGGVVRRRGR